MGTITSKTYRRLVLLAIAAEYQHGYKPEQELLDICYSFPEFKAAQDGEVIVSSDLTDRISVDLNEDDCDSLELALAPEFVVALFKIADGLEHSAIEWNKVKVIEQPIEL